jgi:hypothetical protein
VHLTGILTGKNDLYWGRRPPFSLYLSYCVRAGPFNTNILQAAKDLRAGQDALVDIFERIETFFRRLEIYTSVPPNEEMVDAITAIMVEVLSILAIATKEIRQGRTSKSLRSEIVAIDRDILRKISQEACRKDRHRGCIEEAGQADARGGSNGHCASSEGYAYH